MKKLLASALLCAALALSVAAETYQIAVIPKGTTHEFWKSIHAGALAAAKELEAGGVEAKIIWKGPLREDDREQQVQVVENFTGRRVSGIVLAPLDSKALVGPVSAAARGGIPTVVIDSALNADTPVSFVATDNYKGGTLAARRLGELLGGKGKVILLRYAVGSASTEAREAGFVDTLKKEFPDIALVSADQHAGATRDTAKRASENLINRYGRALDGVFCPNESSTVGMLLALRDAGLAQGRVKFVGFDAGAQTLQALKAGDLQGLVVQNPYRMGYLGVKTLVDHLQGKPVEKEIDTGCALVTKENLDTPDVVALIKPPEAK
ncbi:MAG TPA: substrate-binding domain-containing protein [Opitutaceae bacterium]